MLRKRFMHILGIVSLLLAALFLLAAGRTPAREGWLTDGGHTYYYRDGAAMTGWLTLDGSRYYFAENGAMATSWQTVGGETYYFAENGVMQTGWLTLDGSRYYLRSDGTRVTGWLTLDTQCSYLYEDGRAAVGLVQIDGKTYVFAQDGTLAYGLTQLEAGTVYADLNGHPVTGWVEDRGSRYYFRQDYLAATGWAELDGKRYYFRENGTLARGAVTIDGQTRYFSAGGQEIILVNPWTLMPSDYTVELADIGGGHQLAAFAVDDLNEMLLACKDAGMRPAVCSSYRTQEYQEKLFARKVKFYTDQGYDEEKAAELAGRSVARPGTSEHQLGLALDIVDNRNWNLDETQAKTPTQRWLMENSWKYGFLLRYPDGTSEATGIIYEPWHYRYVGREIAAEVHDSGLCLEEYLQMLTDQ